jgi:hypothetical protein
MTRKELTEDLAKAGLSLESRVMDAPWVVSPAVVGHPAIHEWHRRGFRTLTDVECWWRLTTARYAFCEQVKKDAVSRLSAADSNTLDGAVRYMWGGMSGTPRPEDRCFIPEDIHQAIAATSCEATCINPDGTFGFSGLSGRGWREKAIRAWAAYNKPNGFSNPAGEPVCIGTVFAWMREQKRRIAAVPAAQAAQCPRSRL